MSAKRSFLAAFNWVDWCLTAAACAAIGYGLYRAYDLPPTDWANVAGPLFSLASGLLFVLALRVQLREHRQAISEMEQANTNHASILLVATQEKEFDVVVAAIAEVRQHIDGIEYSGSKQGQLSIVGIIRSWRANLVPETFQQPHCEPMRSALRIRDMRPAFPNFESLDELLVKLRWLAKAVETKKLAEDDRTYLQARVEPLVRDTNLSFQHIGWFLADLEAWMKDHNRSQAYAGYEEGLQLAIAKLSTMRGV